MAVRAWLLACLLGCAGASAPVRRTPADVAAAVLAARAPRPPYKLVACATFHNEAPYLREWVLYHYLIGFEHFYLFDSGSTDGPAPELQPLVDRGLVTYAAWGGPVGEASHCFRASTGGPLNGTEWLAALEVSEFVVTAQQYPVAGPFSRACALWVPSGFCVVTAPQEQFLLQEHLAPFLPLRYGALHMDRYMFTSSGHRARPAGLVVEAYTQREVAVGPWPHDGRVAVRADAFAGPGPGGSLASVALGYNWTCVHGNHRPWAEGEGFRTYDPVRVHRYARSFDECVAAAAAAGAGGAGLCGEMMEGEPEFDKRLTTVDAFLPAMGFPPVLRAMLQLLADEAADGAAAGAAPR